MLSIENIHTYYGHIHALKGISLEVREKEIVCLIGSNGAGKSTTLMTVNGILHPAEGRILFLGQDITMLPADKIAGLGITQVPEGRRILPRLSVQDNLEMGAFLIRDKKAIRQNRDEVYDMFPLLAKRCKQQGGTLSGGEQQMLAIGRALMSKPKLLLLDEPSLGLAPKFVTRIFLTIRELQKEGMTILLVEQNARHALRLADQACVLERGRIVLRGTGQELLNMPEVQDTYLGQHAA